MSNYKQVYTDMLEKCFTIYQEVQMLKRIISLVGDNEDYLKSELERIENLYDELSLTITANTNSINNNIENINNSIDLINNLIDNLNNELQNLTNRVSTNENLIRNNSNAISNLETRVSNNEINISKKTTYIHDIKFEYNDTSSNLHLVFYVSLTNQLNTNINTFQKFKQYACYPTIVEYSGYKSINGNGSFSGNTNIDVKFIHITEGEIYIHYNLLSTNDYYSILGYNENYITISDNIIG